MQQYNDRDGGALFRNADRSNDTQPLYTGFVTVAGRKYRMAGWMRTSKAGQAYMSLKITDEDQSRQGQGPDHGPRQYRRPASAPQHEPAEYPPLDDEIPF